MLSHQGAKSGNLGLFTAERSCTSIGNDVAFGVKNSKAKLAFRSANDHGALSGWRKISNLDTLNINLVGSIWKYKDAQSQSDNLMRGEGDPTTNHILGELQERMSVAAQHRAGHSAKIILPEEEESFCKEPEKFTCHNENGIRPDPADRDTSRRNRLRATTRCPVSQFATTQRHHSGQGP